MGRRVLRWCTSQLSFVASLAAIASAAGPADAASIGIGSDARVNTSLRSMKDLRDENVVKQRFDYSCGAAALATIMNHSFGDPVTERQIVDDLFALLPEDEKPLRRREGFSLLDLQGVAEARGYEAQGFMLAPADLPRLAGPVIVFIQPRGYKHFAVLRGVKDDRVYLADPSRGNIRMPAYGFIESWVRKDGKGIIFVVEPENGTPDPSPIAVLADGMAQPEIMTARQMLAVGSPYARLPHLSR